MPHRNRVVVIDDKAEDGEAIVKSLWRLQVPSFFFHYDDDFIGGLKAEKKFEGIRFIFQDIALLSPDFPGRDDYAAAAVGIDKVLSDQNGPWLLIAWSTWGNDPDKGDKYARELFDYLTEKLPAGKRPYQFVVIDKRRYSSDGEHAVVKGELDEEEKKNLIESVAAAMRPVESLEALALWESNIKGSASKVVHGLWDMINNSNPDDIDEALGGLLLQLAVAQEGSRLNKNDDLSYPLYQILSGLLHDEVSNIIAGEIKIGESVKQNIDAGKINKMLHWEEGETTEKSSPGCVYDWPDHDIVNLGALRVSRENIKEFIIDAFVSDDQNKRKTALADEGLEDCVKLVLLDITPACDHANNKAFWRKFLVGVKADSDLKHFHTKGSKLAGDYLKDSPIFSSADKSWRFIFNSRLVVSLPDRNEYISERVDENSRDRETYMPEVSKLVAIGRIRDQLLQEMMTWYGVMATRPGIVSLK